MSNVPTTQEGGGRRRRVLFVAEAVTLAHVARPVALARGLDPARFDAVLAVDPRDRALWKGLTIPSWPIRSIPSEQFRDALARGRPPYDVETLRAYVRDDLEVIKATAPDVVVGDFRLSLAISTRVTNTPYLAITNAYWSPYGRQRFPMPELHFARRLGIPIARRLFRVARPFAFAYHTLPLNRVRREYGLPSLGFDLRRIYTEADHTFYADVPEMVPTFGRPDNHHYLGPILWSPAVELPPWWQDVPRDRPVVYVTLGSSGRSELLSSVLDALADLHVSVLAATLGRSHPHQIPGKVWVADVLPGERAAARASLVICNGGSPTTHQALAASTPVLGLAGNMDQHLNMEAVQRLGAGILLRSESADPGAIRAAVTQLLDNPAYSEAAFELARIFSAYDAPRRFQAILSDVAYGYSGGHVAGGVLAGLNGRETEPFLRRPDVIR
jgi:UDP:flavonoid glycosyltransferase YjiC (YdhE family)